MYGGQKLESFFLTQISQKRWRGSILLMQRSHHDRFLLRRVDPITAMISA
ncbi:hypothetical protein V6Z11_A08G173300 [Gossypium hirsutum]